MASCNSCGTNVNIYPCPCSSTPVRRATTTNNTPCNCSSSSTERFGTKKIVRSYPTNNKSCRAVFFAGGGCDVIAKGYIPSTHNLTSNGRKHLGCQWGVNPQPESEGMDCLNYRFNKQNPAVG